MKTGTEEIRTFLIPAMLSLEQFRNTNERTTASTDLEASPLSNCGLFSESLRDTIANTDSDIDLQRPCKVILVTFLLYALGLGVFTGIQWLL